MAFCLTHFHLDQSGAFQVSWNKRPRVCKRSYGGIATGAGGGAYPLDPPHLQSCFPNVHPIRAGGTVEMDGLKITAMYAGHLLGLSCIELNMEDWVSFTRGISTAELYGIIQCMRYDTGVWVRYSQNIWSIVFWLYKCSGSFGLCKCSSFVCV
eukprot:GHVO01014398.1.p2 GENE.GHVO01014398.1~~GHVO01014398.1.p2  ORF type:complete len:153 (-),score=14.56 GHVO01014398.1:96-554(-)